MAKEEKPLEYQRRIRDTKGIAQRLDLHYLYRPAFLAVLRRRLTWGLIGVALLGTVPLILGLGKGREALASGPLSSPHALFEDRCEVCHAQAFRGVADTACLRCHDGAAHPAKSVDRARSNGALACVECHVEHRGDAKLTLVSSGNCTRCHADLKAHASDVKLKAAEITAFRPGRHPEFASVLLADTRPIKLNHAIHMPAQPKVIRGMKLPIECGDCHATNRESPAGDLVPVTFELNCKSCHARELEFDVYQVLGPRAGPSPHSKDPKSIHEFILTAYRKALEENPDIVRQPLGSDLAAQPNQAAWLARVVSDSETYLFQKKCSYCHEDTHFAEGFLMVKKVNRIQGHYSAASPDGDPWLPRAEFNHRAHRAVACESCHTTARASKQTADVLIPAMKTCLPCHGDSASLGRCSECHLYHNRSLERERERRPSEQLLSMGGIR